MATKKSVETVQGDWAMASVSSDRVNPDSIKVLRVVERFSAPINVKVTGIFPGQTREIVGEIVKVAVVSSQRWGQAFARMSLVLGIKAKTGEVVESFAITVSRAGNVGLLGRNLGRDRTSPMEAYFASPRNAAAYKILVSAMGATECPSKVEMDTHFKRLSDGKHIKTDANGTWYHAVAGNRLPIDTIARQVLAGIDLSEFQPKAKVETETPTVQPSSTALDGIDPFGETAPATS